MDPYVISVPWILRKLIVSCFILPFRPKSTAEAYETIWMKEGSPLLFYTKKLRQQLEEKHRLNIEIAMRYGNPGISEALESFDKRGIHNLYILPLYPQFCDATVTTSINEVIEKNDQNANLHIVPPFYSSEEFVNSSKTIIAEHLPTNFDHLLFSYHSLPERQIKKSDSTGALCLAKENCCSTDVGTNTLCYRRQCLKTSELIAKGLKINSSKYSSSFQSKLGPIPWLSPSTEEILGDLARSGVKRLVVGCPSFVADNLETLEEIGTRGKETFINAGGEDLTLIPCLNDHPEWVASLSRLLINHSSKDAKAVTSV